MSILYISHSLGLEGVKKRWSEVLKVNEWCNSWYMYINYFSGEIFLQISPEKSCWCLSLFSCKRCLYSPCHVMRVRLLPCDHHSRVTCWWDAFVLAVKICQLCHQRTLSPSSRKNQKELNKWVAALSLITLSYSQRLLFRRGCST